jgi:hypothetical protein
VAAAHPPCRRTSRSAGDGLRRYRDAEIRIRAGVALLAAFAAGALVGCGTGEDAPTTDPVTVTWAGTEDGPACRYDKASGRVEVALSVTGTAPAPEELSVTVTAYADENTSRPVGSTTRAVAVDGATDETLRLTIEVERPPHVGEDDVAACSLDVR